jgi:hypothetical protein
MMFNIERRNVFSPGPSWYAYVAIGGMRTRLEWL